MTITIQNKVNKLESLSAEAQLMIQLIPEGQRWLELSEQANAPSFVFESEVQLLSTLLDGVHGTELLFIEQLDLLVDPERLMSVGEQSLQTIVDFVASGKNKKNVNSIIKKSQLLSNVVLKTQVEIFFEECGLNEQSLFQVMSLNNYIELYFLANDDEVNEKFAKSDKILAANYAISLAQTVSEFCDFFRFYLNVINELDIENMSGARRKKRVNEIFEALADIAHGMLVCPQISGLTNAEQVNDSIKTWLEYSGNFGFSSFSKALVQLSKNIPLNDLQSDTLISGMNNYSQKINEFLNQNEVGAPALSQDGKFLTYSCTNDGSTITFSLNQHGCLALEEFLVNKTPKNL